jgi:hypothetical protein
VFSGIGSFGASSKSFFEILDKYDISNFFVVSFADEYYKDNNKSIDSKQYFNYFMSEFDKIENSIRNE